VIAGDLDSTAGPAVFARLKELRVGDQVLVRRADGSTAAFAVTGSVQVAKNAFPTDAVYGPVADAQLRLITCGGVFDRRTGHYVDNVVVFARLV
jgi:sortase (surface protein transpeptidase)